MLDKISETTAVPVKAEAINKTPGIIKEGNGSAGKEKNEVQKGEIRKNEINDGELKTKVYDENGKLLRVIPPGYLLTGEQKFDFTI
jgi:hypothetical protein